MEVCHYDCAPVTPSQSATALRSRRKSRRTQAECSPETCEKIIAAATECIAQRGFSRAEHVGTRQNGMLRGNKNRKGVRHG